VRLAEKAGFKISARQRQSVFKNGELYDTLMMDILREEYFARHSDLIDSLPAIT
jgi:RimJ/RimL family protein N-acetyltransferase